MQRAPRPLDLREARLAAADLLSRRAWTCAELDRRLRRRGAPDEVAAAVVSDLAGRGYLDDAAFARHWIETRRARYGPARLRRELQARGVAPALIATALTALSADAALDQARQLARRRLPALQRARPDRLPARLADYLARRGFAPAIVARVVRECGRAAEDR